MNAALRPSDALLPQRPGGMGAGAVLALLVHAGLIAALAFGVSWRAQAPETVSAELWSALPQVAAPKPVETAAAEPTPAPAPPPKPVVEPKPAPPVEKSPPPPPDPEIALRRERMEREKLERDKAEKVQAEKARVEKERVAKLEKDRQDKAERDKLQKQEREKAEREKLEREKAAEAKLAQQREENLRRMMGQIGATGSPSATGTAAQDAGPSKSYAGKLVAHIKPNIVFTDTVTGNPAAEVEVRAGPSGSIVSRRLVKSSGNKDWDEAVLRAIDRTGTLPRDVDGRVPSTILVAFRPQE